MAGILDTILATPTLVDDPQGNEAKRQLAIAMLQRGQDMSSVRHPLQGVNNVLQQMLGAYQLRKTNEAEKTGRAEADRLLLEAVGGGSSVPGATIAPPSPTPPRASQAGMMANPFAQGGGELADRITLAESGGQYDARNPRSSATGPGQFINSTWLSTIRKHMPTLAAGKDDKTLLALRTVPSISREMTAAYARDNAEELTAAGLPANDTTLSLAHFAGSGGAKQVLRADPSTPVAQLLTPAAMQANPFLRGMTAGQLVAWAGKRVGADSASSATAPAAASLIPQAPTQNPQAGRMAALGQKLMGNPRTADQGRALLLKAATMVPETPDKPAAVQEYEYAVRQGYDKPFTTWKTEQSQAARTQITNTVGAGETSLQKALGEATGKDLTAGRETAASAVQSIQSGQEARRLLDRGIITGPTANVRLAIGEALAAAGLIPAGSNETETLANTRAFMSTMGRQTLGLVKQLGAGSGISNADRDFAEKIAGGSIEVTPDAIERIIDINDRAGRRIIASHNARVKSVLGDNDRYGLAVGEPSQYTPEPRNPDAPRPVTSQTIRPGAAASGLPAGVEPKVALDEARAAIQKRPDLREKVIERLRGWGLSTEGL